MADVPMDTGNFRRVNDTDNGQEPPPGIGRSIRPVCPAMIREDRELLAELARLNGDMASLGLRIMEGSASVIEQQNYAQRLIAAGELLRRRADEMNHPVIEGEVLVDISLALPAHIAELDWKP